MDSSLLPIITAFTVIFMAELGDKTQLTVMMLSSKGSAKSVFLGAMAAFLLVDGVSLLVGGQLLSLIPYNLIGLSAGLLFICMGIMSFIKRGGEAEISGERSSLLKTFSTISLMELGDKTQLSCVVLAAGLNDPFGALVGIMLAFAAVTAIGVLSGAKILRLLPRRYLEIGAAILFIILGILFILNSLTGSGLKLGI